MPKKTARKRAAGRGATKAVKKPVKGKVTKVKIELSKGHYVVRPGHIRVRQGDKIVFMAGNTTATVFFPKPDLFDLSKATVSEKRGGTGMGKGQVLHVGPADKAGKSVLVRTPTDLAKLVSAKRGRVGVVVEYLIPGEYPYAVYCEEGNDFAVGSKTPIITIDPPGDGPPLPAGRRFTLTD